MINDRIISYSFGFSFIVLGLLYNHQVSVGYRELVFCINLSVMLINITSLLKGGINLKWGTDFINLIIIKLILF